MTWGTPSHEAGLLMALETVRAGHATARRSGDAEVFYDRGRPVPDMLVPFVGELFAHGKARLDEAHGAEPARVVLTPAGEDLYAGFENEFQRFIADES